VKRNKTVVRRLVTDVLNSGRLDLIDELHAPELAEPAREWITSFRSAFPDVRMEIIELIAENDTVVGRFTCSATHTGTWRGHPPTGRRFKDVDEVGIYHLADGRIVRAWTLEDTTARMRQLGVTEPGST
jgi:predicted ester cyclase